MEQVDFVTLIQWIGVIGPEGAIGTKRWKKKVHWGPCKKEVLDSTENGMNMPPEGPVENEETKLLWDCNVFNVTH